MVRLHRRWRRARTNDDQLLVAAVVAAVLFVGAATFAVLHPASGDHESARVTTHDDASTTTIGVQVLGETVTTAPPTPPTVALSRRATTTRSPSPDLGWLAAVLARLGSAPNATAATAPPTTTTSATAAPSSTTTTVPPTTSTTEATTTTTGSHGGH